VVATVEARLGRDGVVMANAVESAETTEDGEALNMRQIARAGMSGDGGEGPEQTKYFKAD